MFERMTPQGVANTIWAIVSAPICPIMVHAHSPLTASSSDGILQAQLSET